MTELNEDVDCEEFIKFVYFAFRNDIFNCSGENSAKDDILMSVKGEDNDNISDEFGLIIDYDGRKECPSGCDENNKGLCECESLSIFDIEG